MAGDVRTAAVLRERKRGAMEEKDWDDSMRRLRWECFFSVACIG
jgi:hypothetical protein